ncbi:MAG TPA: hypothetical protein EYO31_09365, partial [Phycisphaerales bacterium]|nr:hypothetical protein [Phycisphaerales bacterium]
MNYIFLFRTKHRDCTSIIGSVHGSKEAFSVDIGAEWKGASIDSPLTRAITGIVGGDAGIEYYDTLDPSGTAEAA